MEGTSERTTVEKIYTIIRHILCINNLHFKIYNKNIKVVQIPLRWKGIKILTKNLVKRAQEKNLLVHVWTINDKKTINHLIDIGVNGIVTDEPDLLMEIMKEKDLISN